MPVNTVLASRGWPCFAEAGWRSHKKLEMDIDFTVEVVFAISRQSQVSCAAHPACLNGKPGYPLLNHGFFGINASNSGIPRSGLRSSSFWR